MIFFVSFSFQAAILQQTAQYIIALESEKTQLLTQNCQLKRLVDQNDNGGMQTVEVVQTVAQTNTSTTGTTQQPHALKKRKIDSIYTMQAISDSSDEGLGSMSPEPTTVTILSSSATNPTTVVTGTAMMAKQSTNGALNAKEFIEMKTLLEMERRKNSALEDRLRQFTECHQTSTTIYANGDRISYEPHEVIEHTDNLRHTDDEQQHQHQQQQVQTVLVDKVHHNMQNVHVLALDSIPTVGQTQVVMCTPVEHEDVEMVETMSRMHRTQPPQIEDDDSRTLSPCDMIHHQQKEELIINGSRPQSPYAAAESHHMHAHAHAIVTHKVSSNTIRLQPILEAAIKAEPKVEVERIHSPPMLKECNTDAITTNGTAVNQPESRMFITHQNRSRQNLETIVEAIRRKYHCKALNFSIYFRHALDNDVILYCCH